MIKASHFDIYRSTTRQMKTHTHTVYKLHTNQGRSKNSLKCQRRVAGFGTHPEGGWWLLFSLILAAVQVDLQPLTYINRHIFQSYSLPWLKNKKLNWSTFETKLIIGLDGWKSDDIGNRIKIKRMYDLLRWSTDTRKVFL